MDKLVLAVVNGKVKPMHDSVKSKFAINEKYGSDADALGLIAQDNREGFECLRYLTTLLVNDAEMCRRDAGLAASELLTVDELKMQMSPLEYAALKVAILQTIQLGYEKSPEDEKLLQGASQAK